MKPFVFSLIAIGLMITIIIFNAFYIKKATEDLSREVSRVFSPRDADGVQDLWKKYKLFISFSASHKEIDKIEEQLKIMKIRLESNDISSFMVSRALLISYIDQIKCHEAITLDNII
jgi:hypothetical protein